MPGIDSMLLLTSSRNVGVARLTWLLCSAIISNVPDMASILPSLVVLFAWYIAGLEKIWTVSGNRTGFLPSA